MRWSAAPSGRTDEEVCAPIAEYSALASIADARTPVALDLLRVGARVWCVTSWRQGRPIVAHPRDDVGRLCRRIWETLTAAHSAGWAHGDLKPSNVLLSDCGEPSLIDWGLATRAGQSAAPGTLGYAPPWAWEPGHVADIRSDTYALAVVAWELLHGRRPFDGDRETMLDCQRSFSFRASGESPDEFIGRLFDAADRGAAVAYDAASPCLRIDLDRVVRIEAVRHANGIAQHVARANPTSPACPVDVFVAHREFGRPVAEAIADRLRLGRSRNCVWFENLIATVEDATANAEGPSTESRVDLMRAALIKRVQQAVGFAKTVSPVVVLCMPEQLDVEATRLWGEFGRALRARPTMDITHVELRLRVNPGLFDRSFVRHVLQIALSASHVDEAAVIAVAQFGGASPLSVLRAAEAIARCARRPGMATEDVLAGVEAAIQGAPEAGDAVGVTPLRDVVSTAERGDGPPCRTSALATVLEQGERAAVGGRVRDLIRAAIRATTETIANDDVAPGDICRLADLWTECGRQDAVESVLRPRIETAPLLVYRMRLARAYMSMDQIDAARPLVEGIERDAESPDDRAESEQLLAWTDLFEGRHLAAYQRLRRALRLRRSLKTWTLVRLLMTSGNAARLIGRNYSAKRVLLVAQRRAEDLGAVSTSVAASNNLILASVGEVGAERAAAEWRVLAEVCQTWGLMGDAYAHSVRAAWHSLLADDPLGASHRLCALNSSPEVSAASSKHWRDRAARIRVEALDRAELLGELLALVPEGAVTSGAVALRAALVRAEVHGTQLEDDGGGASDSVEERRVVGLVYRALLKRSASPAHRLARVLRLAGSYVNAESPVVVHGWRLALRDADVATTELALSGIRSARGLGEREDRTTAALHVLGVAWGLVRSRDACSWLVEHASRDDSARPPGVRKWEWQLGLGLADLTMESVDPSDVAGDSVLQRMEGLLANLTEEAQLAYSARVPLQQVARLCGLAVQDGIRARPSTAGGLFVWFRAELQRAACQHRGARGRAAGLERVLKSALRLRSTGSVDELLREIVSGVISVCRAERAVVLYESGRACARAKVATLSDLSDMAPAGAEVSRSVLELVRTTGRACLIDDAVADHSLGERPSVQRYRPRSLIVAPLRTVAREVGYLYVENRTSPKSFSESDLELVEGFAAQAALALENVQLVEELRASCRDLAEARSEAVRAENLRVLGRMAGEVAHDFNNLLTAILGETQLLMQSRQFAGARQSLLVIERAAKDGAFAIRRIQDSTRARGTREFEEVDLGQIIRDVLDLTRVRWSTSRNNSIHVTANIEPLVLVRGIASELREVFTNIVNNAVDAMVGGGELSVSAKRNGDLAVATVVDTGCGIPPDILPHIFEPFFTTKGEVGNGLGLSIAHGIIRRHGGAISVATEAQRGSTMTVELPIARVGVLDADWADRPAAQLATGERRRLLVVDDESSVARVLAEMARAEGFEVEIARDGATALRMLEGYGQRFELVVTDLHMPEINGFDVAAVARRMPTVQRVVLMTGWGTDLNTASLQEHCIDAVLEKPFSIEDVRRILALVS